MAEVVNKHKTMADRIAELRERKAELREMGREKVRFGEIQRRDFLREATFRFRHGIGSSMENTAWPCALGMRMR